MDDNTLIRVPDRNKGARISFSSVDETEKGERTSGHVIPC